MTEDVPSPIDLRQMPDAIAWEASALTKRPCRPQFFAVFSEALSALSKPQARVLELGSGPGFLAEHLLRDHPAISYVALDFSPAMHHLAAQRLGPCTDRVAFVERSFREVGWASGLGQFDCVVTNQAVHELRHRRHALALHRSVRQVLRAGGAYLVCDHFYGPGGQSNDQLYMSVHEQRVCLQQAGFMRVQALLKAGGLVLHAAD